MLTYKESHFALVFLDAATPYHHGYRVSVLMRQWLGQAQYNTPPNHTLIPYGQASFLNINVSIFKGNRTGRWGSSQHGNGFKQSHLFVLLALMLQAAGLQAVGPFRWTPCGEH